MKEAAMVTRSSSLMRERAKIGDPSVAIPLHGFVLPAALGSFVQGIERSRAMLDLDDDWDGEGSPGYAEATWRRAVGIAIASASRFFAVYDEVPPAPSIAKGPDGSVDVLWQSVSKKVMINVPADSGSIAYHGYDPDNPEREIKGLLDPADANGWILSWLTE
jgi:hypothetical protein